MKLANDDPITRQQADEGYGRIRMTLILSALWFIGVGAVMAIFDIGGWQIFLPAVVVLEAIMVPTVLVLLRRELDRKVRAAEEGLAGEISPPEPSG